MTARDSLEPTWASAPLPPLSVSALEASLRVELFVEGRSEALGACTIRFEEAKLDGYEHEARARPSP